MKAGWQPRVLFFVALASFLAGLALVSAGYFLISRQVNHNQQRNEQKLCGVVTLVKGSSASGKATSTYGRQLQESMAKLYNDLDCAQVGD